MNLWLMFLITTAIMYVSLLCTTMYLHRRLTHGGVEFHHNLEIVMHFWLCLFTGIAPREWVAVHRKHHQFSDRAGDPHSPYLLGLWHVLFGNAAYYRRAAQDKAMVAKYAADYQPTLVDKVPYMNSWGILLGIALFVLMFGWAWGLGLFVLQAVVYILLNASVNSFCHMVGYRNFDNLATNITIVAWLTGGEGLHNNHHEEPTGWLFARVPGEFDPAGGIIRVLAAVGWAKVCPLPWLKNAA